MSEIGADAGSAAADGGAAEADDASAADGGGDAGPAGPVATLVVKAGGGVASVSVLFCDATGTLLESVTPGPDGRASRAVDPAGTESVTIVVNYVNPAGQLGSAFTVFGIRPGDEIPIKDLSPTAFMVARAALPVRADTQYFTSTGEGAQGFPPSTTSTNIRPYVSGPETFSVAFLAHPGGPGGPNAYSFKKKIPFESNKDVVVPGFSAWMTDLMTARVTAVNAPPQNGTPHVGFWHVADEALIRAPGSVAGSGADRTYLILPGFADAFIRAAFTMSVSFPPVSQDFRIVAQRSVTVPASTELDLGAAALSPPLTGLVVSGSVPRLDLSWDGGSSASTGRAVVSRIEWGGSSCSWTILAPPGTTKISTPEIPGGTFGCATLTSAKTALVMSIESDAFKTYEDAKPHVAALGRHLHGPETAASVDFVPRLPLSGTYRLSGAFENGVSP